jgi:predicted porin
MKHKILVGLIASLATTAAFAQSNVTVYGLIDLSVNYTTNQNAKGDAVWSLGDSGAIGDAGQGALSGSRLGFKGEEDLGGGNKALFKMEAGITANNGQSDQQGQLFGRQAYVGLANKDLGQLTFGRQYGVATDTIFDFDPIGAGNYLANEWELFLVGVRFDNTIMYHNAWGPVQLNLQYSLGGQSGSTSIGDTLGFNVKYNQGPLGLAGAYQQSTDANSNKLTVGMLDADYAFGPVTLFANYYNIKSDAGFKKAGSLSGGALANTSMFINNNVTIGTATVALPSRTDELWTLGLAYKFSPNDTLTAAYMDDQISQAIVGDGSMKTGYILYEHNLSKRTEVYLNYDTSKVTGQAIVTGFNGVGAGQTTSSAFSAGMRVIF